VSAILAFDSVAAGYEHARVLHGISFAVGKGDAVAVLGRTASARRRLSTLSWVWRA